MRTQRFSFQLELCCVREEAIHDGIGSGWIACIEIFVPLVLRKLTGDDHRSGPMSAIDEIEQMFAFVGLEARFNAEVVENEQRAAINIYQTLPIAAIYRGVL